MRPAVILGLSFLALSASAAAAVGTEKDAKKDPNRVICERQEEVGSRLSTKRVCRTAAEWDTIRQEARQSIDKAQTNRGDASGR